MKRLIGLSVIALALAIFTSVSFAQEKIKTQVKSQVKTQVQTQTGINGQQARTNWVDLDGDGICDNFNSAARNRNLTGGKGFGMQNKANGGTMGMGNARGFGDGSGLRPQDGTGFGYKNGGGTGTGVCDGTGPKGNAKGRNK